MRTTETTGVAPLRGVRGGVSLAAILTGVVVAFGAMFILSALIGGVLAALGVVATDVTSGEVIEAGIGAGMAFVVAQFLAYLWGGYTAGRMGRGAGIANGLLVPLVAIVVVVIVGGIATALGAEANLNAPFGTTRLAVEQEYLVDWGVTVGIAALVAMFLGGAIGGGAGSRWHTQLERRREVEVRSGDATATSHATTTSSTGAAGAGTGVPTTGSRTTSGDATTTPDTSRS